MGSEPDFAADLSHPILHEDEWNRITAVVDAFENERPAHIAVIADPFAGQDVLMKGLLRRYSDRVIHLPFFSVVKGRDFLTQITGHKDIVVMDHCHFLATRKIGGFAMVDAFLDHLSTSERLFITQWNSFTWSYLKATRHIETFFPVVIVIPEIDSKTLKKLMLSRYTDEIEFVAGEPSGNDLLSTDSARIVKLPFCEKQYSISLPHLFGGNGESGKRTGVHPEDAEDIAFDKIIRIADGNYGVAERIWDGSLDGNTLRVAEIPELPCAISLDINESFLLTIILSMESVSIVDLAEIAGPEINLKQTLFRLTHQGLVFEKKGYFGIKPEALGCVKGYLKRIRMVW
ncbi:hypothetical protein [Methanogenium organophilum]|uniref:Uncharacterized protein n=1 Tax=Methanogenium organophilum TaxID=2199 RepID=A0A9X9S4U5_METOG|nr:hypothetical protein [Methanogenium organophilum]WAI01696.1 hypothetical protein OU421_02155 [Methanogenium organophilum]